MYLEHDAFVERGIEWDRKELDMIEAWQDKKMELDVSQDREQIGGEVHEWNPLSPKQDGSLPQET